MINIEKDEKWNLFILERIKAMSAETCQHSVMPQIQSTEGPVCHQPSWALFFGAAGLYREGFFTSITVAVFVFLMTCASMTQAANIPNYDSVVDLTVREQDVAEFIDALFREIDVPVVVSKQIKGTVNGRFNNTAEKVFEEVSSAFNVIAYFDGAVAYVYNSNQLLRRVLPANKVVAQRVVNALENMGMPDRRNSISIEDSSIVASGTERFLEQVEEVLSSISGTVAAVPSKLKPSNGTELAPPMRSQLVYRVFKLDHAWADDTSFEVGGQSVVIPGVATIMKNLMDNRSSAIRALSGREVARRQNTVQGLRGSGLSSSANDAPEVKQSENILVEPGNDDAVRIVADTRLNAVIIRDFEDRMPAHASLIRSLDAASGMVEIEATIIDVNTDKSRELGVNWRANDGDVDVLFGSGDGSDRLLLPGSQLLTPQGRGGILSLALGEQADFLARIRLLEERGAARIVSKPHVITLSDVEAVLGAQTEFFVRVAGDQQVDLFNVPVGTVLRVTPHIFSESGSRKVKLLVNIEDGSQSPTETVDLIPVIERASISTQAVVEDGDSLLIGGLVRDSFRKSDYRVPLLGDIPFLGRLFRSDRSSTSRVERLFMITPRLADGQGFGKNDVLPMLQGGSNNILSDSSSRLDSVNWPLDRDGVYWTSDETGHDVVQRRSRSGISAETAGISAMSERGVRGAVSRFTVEAWPVDSTYRP